MPYTREAATLFLSMCFSSEDSAMRKPCAGWDKRVGDYVPLTTPEEIDDYLSQFPRAAAL